jgi:predicted CxxxxCH...CXXCH cytochrome family protein
MHCANPSYDTAVILPPYNTVWAQVLQRGNPPKVVTAGLTVEYRVVNNTLSSSKGLFWQFWMYCKQLFGVTLANDTGLNLVDSSIHNGLSGKMVAKGDHFQVNGIPVTPVNDAGVWNPYQIIEVTVKNSKGTVVAQTRTTIPISDEINCAKCHNGSANPMLEVLKAHDKNIGTNLVGQQPVLCASCHGSPALGQSGRGSSGKYLSEAIHGSHATKGASCYDCHPGTKTQCSRSLAHTAADGNCSNASCHGSMATMAASITNNSKVPWVNEPQCVSCHAGVAQVDTGNTLFRNAIGHGGVYCSSCHGSAHAMVPSRVDIDNYQSRQYQNYSKAIGSCGACHSNSKGAGLGSDFMEAHGAGKRPNACYVCHTAITTTNTAKWPHQFQWKSTKGSGVVSGD